LEIQNLCQAKYLEKRKEFIMVDFDFSGRIKAILKELNLNQVALAAKMNLSQGVISEFANGDRLPSKEFIFGLSKLEISLDWFLTGIGEMFLASISSLQRQELANLAGGHKVPLLRQKVSCGPGVNWQDENNILDYIYVFDMVPRLKSKRLFALDGEVYCKRLEFDGISKKMNNRGASPKLDP
jgi:transcriptional regulator with XRE-family HTH domain